ncbi:MAG: hypothetical protein JNK72_02590 [Myxococcales bacterium]|nr:hypothetical protein [Myxococcales bacterium]
MKHKLFHTLVLSGAALVEGCASTPHQTAVASSAPGSRETHDHAQRPAGTPAAEAPAGTATPTAATAPPVESPEAVRAMVADARSCNEVGWATTKSAGLLPKTRVVHEGQAYWCLAASLQRTPRCCAEVPGQQGSP